MLSCLVPLAAGAQTAPIVQRASAAVELGRLIDSVSLTRARSRLQCHENSPARFGNDDRVDFIIKFVRGPVDTGHLHRALPLDTLTLAQTALRTECPSERAPRGRTDVAFSVAPSFLGVVGATASAGAALPGLSVQSAMVQGLTTFLLDRARDELVLTFLMRVRSTIDTNLLPSSWATLARLESVNYGALLPTLKAAAARDLDSLPARLVARVPATNARDTTVRFVLRNGVRLALAIRDGAPPHTILSELAAISPRDVPDTVVRTALLRIGILAREYRMNADALLRLAADTGSRRLLVTYFVADEMRERRFAGPAEALAFFQQHSGDVLTVAARLRELQALVESMQTRVVEAKISPVDAYANVLRQSARLVLAGNQLLYNVAPDARARVDTMAGHLNTAAELYALVVTKRYQEVMFAVMELARLTSYDIPAGTRNFLAFASTIAAVEDPKQVNEALRAAALPVGSYRTKRQIITDVGRVSIGINAYAGLGVGRESVRLERGTAGSSYFAPALPFGIELSRAYKGYSVGAFVPLIDVGTLASTRFKSDTAVAQEPEIGFAQVFAPGLFVVFGITANQPFAVGLGYQHVPRLRQTSEGDKAATRQFALFFAVDIPVFRF